MRSGRNRGPRSSSSYGQGHQHGDRHVARRRSAQRSYSFDNFFASIPYGGGRVAVTDQSIALPIGGGLRLFRRRDAPTTYQTQSPDSGPAVVVTFDRHGQLF